ncbi:MAG: DUF4011 domain-containing protein [Planctomycetota bacterium]|nr:DUF4011 domain-containing protein [Planctomycetota bacterium]
MIEAKLQEIRRSLLDLTRNNRLLNHRNAGQRTLQIVDELPTEVWRILVGNDSVMQFLAREEAPPEIRDSLPPEDGQVAAPKDVIAATAETAEMPPVSAGLPLAAVASNGAANARHKDRNLQTYLSGEKLQTRLVHLAREANSALQEQGCNILYLTLGMVRWMEADDTTIVSSAPLIFVPIELKRKNVNTRYAVQSFDDDIVANPSFTELCANQFHFEMPGFEAEKDDMAEYFAKVEKAIAGMKGWAFAPEIHIGLFSFSKLLMYRDLDPRNWPKDASLVGHPLIQQLTGIELPESGDGNDEMPDPSTLDQILKPAECFQIVDADSSQQAAILAAKQGISMVIDGPPGTGKSQTITNIIAECLAEGRTVLFVAEKAVALEVVKRRLEQAGVGDFVLELHSRQASKKTVLDEINRALERQVAASRVAMEPAEELQRTRDLLNAYRRELHTPLGALNISPFEAMSRAIGLSGEPEAMVDLPDVMNWSATQLAESEQHLQTLDRRLARVVDPQQHSWRGVGLTAAGLNQKQRIAKACDGLVHAISDVLTSAASAATSMGRPAPRIVQTVSAQQATARILLDTPVNLAGAISDERWNPPATEVFAWLNLGGKREKLKKVWQGLVRPEAESEDWTEVLTRRRLHGPSILRWLRPSWFRDSKRLQTFMLDPKLPAISKQVELLIVLGRSRELRTPIESQVEKLGGRFGPVWQGIEGEWTALEKYGRSAVLLRQLILADRISAASALKIVQQVDRSAFNEICNSVTTALDRLSQAWKEWLESIASTEMQWLNADWQSVDLSNVVSRLAELPVQMELIGDWIDLQQSIREGSAGPISPFITWVLSAEAKPARGRLAPVFRRHFHRLWVEQAMARCESLRGFRGQDHETLIARFRALDAQWLISTRDRLAAMLASRRPNGAQPANRQSKLGLLQAEMRKKTRHMPLRKLLASAGEVVQSIKPCFMMSPLSVAQYLAPGSMKFDVVVFDEASQIEPADAYGAVARAGQLLLVGDERQLPPTNFFGRVDSEVLDGDGEAQIHSADLESILSLGIVRLRHRCGLRWHYRSQHSSLIEFSNYKFYDGALRVFPSPHTDCSQNGLAFRYVEAAVYMRGAGRFNPVEALAVATEVMRHAVEHPELSLGIGTLNQPQQRAIEDEVERLRRSSKDPCVESFFTRHAGSDPFFVKNLENIQGDERDVIFLSVGFGKDPSGKLHVNFGALNSDGGWRRLNVLITRARRRCVVFSSIRSEEIDLGATQARGVVALKEYLYAAEHGHVKDAAVPGGDHESDFEASVCRALRDHGWEVHAQVGCAGFAIDLGVVDPRSPGRYLMGIECDGATYHSSPTARDRDRLRQEVLEDLGWKIYRIWSSDWFTRPGQMLEAVLKRLNELKGAAVDSKETTKPASDAPNEPSTPAPKTEEAPAPPNHVHLNSEPPPGTVLYKHDRNSKPIGNVDKLLAMPAIQLAEIIRKIVAGESPIHMDEALHACAGLFDAKATQRPREVFEKAVGYAIAAGLFERQESFLWTKKSADIHVRFRGGDCPVTDPEMIATEEIQAAIRLVLKQQFGLKTEAVSESAVRVFGFARTGPKWKSAIEYALAQMNERGEIRTDGAGFITLVHEK